MKDLLLLHGAIGAKDQLEPLALRLRNDFRIHTLSFSGHGGEPMPEKFSIELFAKDVLKFLDKNKIDTISIFGYSMGGYVALYLAKYHPHRVEKVFTLATKFAWTPDISQKEIRMLDAAKIEEKIPAFAKTLAERHQPHDWKILIKKTADMMVDLGFKNSLTLPDLESIHIPVIVSVGEEDNMVTLDETKAMAHHLQKGKLHTFPDMLHPIEKADLDELSKEIINFFR